MSEERIKYLDMFAGIGGFRTGLTNAGDLFLPVGWCEIDRFCQKAYRALYGTGGEYFSDDATKIDTEELPDIDLICGGFPCQPFSVSGRRRGFDDTRGTLFHEIVRVAESKRPQYLLLENVPGLLNHNGGKTFGTIIRAIHELGYCLEWCVLNSADFGVPQQRKRVYIVGYLDPRLSGKIFPLKTGDGTALKQIIPGGQGQRVYRMMSINTKDINIPNSPQGYQRSRKEKNRIAEIVANFDERIANEPKLSYRDGHYNCFDGQHTIAARKAINKGKDLMIRCKVYYEQTLEDEAFLFANQTGIASKPSPAVTLNAYVMSRNKRAVAFKRAAQKGGVIIEKCTKFGDYRLGCINTALKIFDRIGSASFTDGLKIILEAWDGVSISLRADMLEGVLGFIDLYRDKYVRSLLVEQLKKHTPQEILNSGKLDLTLTGRKRFIHQIYEIYNEGIERKENYLPILF